MEPTEFIITDTDDLIVPNSGLALIGKLLAATKIAKRADSLALPRKPRPEVLHSDALLAMIGLLCLGKSDFGDITPFYENPFFTRALGLRSVPSEPTLRQRMELFEDLPQSFLCKESALMVRRHAPAITRCFRDWVALDVDVSPFDNSNTKKEGIGCTYKLTDGFAPIFAYLAEEGYLVHQEFREGSQHCQKGTPEFLKQAIDYARMITGAKLLVRLDSGNDAENTLETLRKQKNDFVITRNLRKEDRDEWRIMRCG